MISLFQADSDDFHFGFTSVSLRFTSVFVSEIDSWKGRPSLNMLETEVNRSKTEVKPK